MINWCGVNLNMRWSFVFLMTWENYIIIKERRRVASGFIFIRVTAYKRLRIGSLFCNKVSSGKCIL